MVTRLELERPLRQLSFSAARARARNESIYARRRFDVSSKIAQGVQLATERGEHLLDLAGKWEKRSLSLQERLGLFEDFQATITHPDVEVAMQRVMQRIGEQVVARDVQKLRGLMNLWPNLSADTLAKIREEFEAEIEEVETKGVGDILLIPLNQGNVLIRALAGTYNIMPGWKQDIDVVMLFDTDNRRTVADTISEIMGDTLEHEHDVDPTFPDGLKQCYRFRPEWNPGDTLRDDNYPRFVANLKKGWVNYDNITPYFFHGFPEEKMHEGRERILHALYLLHKNNPEMWQGIINNIIERYEICTSDDEPLLMDLVKTKYLRWDHKELNIGEEYDRAKSISDQLVACRSTILRELLEQTATEDISQQRKRRKKQ